MTPEAVQILLTLFDELAAEAVVVSLKLEEAERPAQYYEDGRADAYKQAAQHVRIAAGLEDA